MEKDMVAKTQTPEQFLDENDVYDYEIIGDYFIGRFNVIYGKRIRAGRLFDMWVDVDLCCGTSEELLTTVKRLYSAEMRQNIEKGENPLEGLITWTERKPAHNDLDYMKWLAELKESIDA
jgi:hypothetical protein